MRPSLRIVLLLAVPVAIVAGCKQDSGVQNITTRIKDPDQAPKQVDGVLATTLSCSGRGCHADLDRSEKAPRFPSSCSYSLWSDNDPHARAYQVLHGELGQRMGKLLGIDVTTDPRCLACHVTPEASSKKFIDSQTRPQDEWMFGVGCESCHGPATKWLHPHYKEKWTKNAEAEEVKKRKKELGYRDLSGLVDRARLCAGCHIGAPADEKSGVPVRDMNHDFIAAGHPRLMFEYGAFLANLPRHWTERDEEKDDARIWTIGQLVSAEASMKLLADRASVASKNDPTRPWPEFSEYDCYACHQTLVPDSWRNEKDKEKSKGQLRPTRWYTSLLDVVGVKADPKKLDELMRKRYPDPAAVKKEAEAIHDATQGPLSGVEKLKADDFKKYLAALKARGQKLDAMGWDEVEQIGLGLLPLSRGVGDKETEKTSRELLKALGFPKGYDSNPIFRRIERDDKGTTKSPSEEQLKKLFGELK